MTYTEFRKTYNWTVRNYPDTTSLYRDNMEENFGHACIRNYCKRGSRWVLVSETIEEDVTPLYYFNTVDAVPFFRNIDGYEKVTMSYTKYGYIPVMIDSINPDRTKKTVRAFAFD